MFKFDYTNEWDAVFTKLDKLQDEVPRMVRRIMFQSATRMDAAARAHLQTQGRGGFPPPLSEITKVIYSIDGEPDGSGICNNMKLFYYQERNRYIAVLGIVEGRPTMIAKVQNDGAVIPVTDKMRGFFAARYGIGLRKETTHFIVPGRKFWDESWKFTKNEAVRELNSLFRKILS